MKRKRQMMIGSKVYVPIRRIDLSKVEEFFDVEEVQPKELETLTTERYESGTIIGTKSDSYNEQYLVQLSDGVIETFAKSQIFFTTDMETDIAKNKR
jgi:hypothetical protein